MVNSHPCVAESITVQSITSKPSDFNNLPLPEVLWVDWSGVSLDGVWIQLNSEKAEMVELPLQVVLHSSFFLAWQGYRSVMRTRNRCPYVWVSETCIMSILPIGRASLKARPHSSMKAFSGACTKERGEFHGHIFFIRATKTLFQNCWGGTNSQAA